MTFNNINETRQYNSRQLTSLSDHLASAPYTSCENVTYSYPTGANNGKISSMYNAISVETVTYTYDTLNRLFAASGSGWSQQYGFDPFGNLLSKGPAGGGAPSLSISVDAATNRIQWVSGLSYDANGNTLISGVPYDYDVENHLTGAGEYVYDPQNEWIALSLSRRSAFSPGSRSNSPPLLFLSCGLCSRPRCRRRSEPTRELTSVNRWKSQLRSSGPS